MVCLPYQHIFPLLSPNMFHCGWFHRDLMDVFLCGRYEANVVMFGHVVTCLVFIFVDRYGVFILSTYLSIVIAKYVPLCLVPP
jgi:hypothetical protein